VDNRLKVLRPFEAQIFQTQKGTEQKKEIEKALGIDFI